MKRFKKVLLTLTAASSLSVGTALIATNSLKDKTTEISSNKISNELQVKNPTSTNSEYTGNLDLTIPSSWYRNQKKPVFHIKNRDLSKEARFEEDDRVFRMYTGHGIHETMILSPEKRDHVFAVRNYWAFGKYEAPTMAQYNVYFQYWGTEYEYATTAYEVPANPQPNVLDRPLMVDNNNKPSTKPQPFKQPSKLEWSVTLENVTNVEDKKDEQVIQVKPEAKPVVKPQTNNTSTAAAIVAGVIAVGVGIVSFFSSWF